MADTDDDSPRRRKALGKGLGALIPDEDEGAARERYVELPVDQIEPARRQPRTEFDEQRLEELADSIAESGLIQPLVVREKQGRYELIAGERRWRACQRAGLEEAPAVIRDVTDTEAYTLALIENVQREDLNPVEEALAYKKLLEDTGASQAELAEQLGKSRSSLSNSIRLLDLPRKVLDQLAADTISSGHARALIGLQQDQAIRLAEQIAAEGWSVRETEKRVKKLKSSGDSSSSSGGSRYRDDALVRDLTERLQKTLGTKVKVKDRDGKGKIEIHYDDVDILQSVLDEILDDPSL